MNPELEALCKRLDREVSISSGTVTPLRRSAASAIRDLSAQLDAIRQPSEEMVERVARAMHQARRDNAERIMPRTWENLGINERYYLFHMARAAIAAMQEPTDGQE